VSTQLVEALPPSFRGPVAESLAGSDPRVGLTVHLSERLDKAVNPAVPLPSADLVRGIAESAAVCSMLGTDEPRCAISDSVSGQDGSANLREVHGETLRRAILHAPTGQVTVLAAEGLPGIGKTTSIWRALPGLDEGYLWLYASPRLVINGERCRAWTKGTCGSMRARGW
jgi:hypothetical protein